MAGFDPSTAVLSPGQFDPDTAVESPPPQPRGTFAEIGTGALRGALVGLPRLAGQAMQYASEPGNRVYEFGKSIADSAEERGQKPSLQLQPEGRGMVTNALAAGAEMLAPSLAPAVALGVGTAAAGASPFIAGGAALVGMGTLFGAQQGQSTLDKAEKAGMDPNSEPVKTAARINAAQTFATEAAAGYIGGRLLGVFGKSMGQMFTKEAGPLAEATLKSLTGKAGVFKPVLKEMPFTMAGEVGTEMVQEAGVTAVENAYGIDNASPWESAKQVIGPTLGMTALLGPLGLVVRGAQARSAQARTATLASGETSPEIRAQLAGEYANALQASNPEAAGMFRLNANIAIQHKLNMAVDSRLFDAGAVAPPTPEHFKPSATPALSRDPRAGQMVIFPDGTTGYASEIENWVASLPPERQIIERAKLLNLGQTGPAPGNALAPDGTPLLPNAPSPKTLFTFPDGTTSANAADVEAYVAKLPAKEQTAARARLLGLGPQAADKPVPIPPEALTLHEQVKQALSDAGEKPAALLTRKGFAESEQGKGLTGQELAKAYKAYRDSPDTLRDLMRQDADRYDAIQARPQPGDDVTNAPPRDAALPPEPAPPTAMAVAMSTALKTHDIEQAFAARDANKPREPKGAQLADAALRGEVRPNPNAPRSPADLVSDWGAAMAANEMDTKAQARVPFEKKLAALGIDKMATHREQIDALKSVITDKKASQGMRDRVSMLVAKLESEMPAKKPEPKPLEVTEAAAAKTDTQVASEPAGTPTGRQAVLEGLVQPEATRMQTLETMHVRVQEEAAVLAADPNPDPAKVEAMQTKLTHMAAVETQAKALDEADALSTPPAQAEVQGTNIVPGSPTIPGVAPNNKFTSEQQALLDGLLTGAGGRTAALNRMRERVGNDMQELLEKHADSPTFDLRMERLVAKAADMDAIADEALSMDRNDRAGKQAAKEAAPPVGNELAQAYADTQDVAAIADQTADKIAELRAGFTQRLRAGEVLSPLEQERQEDLAGFARAVATYTTTGGNRASPSDAGYVEAISQFVYEASKPYEKSKRGTTGEDDVLSRIVRPEQVGRERVDLGLLGPAAMSHRLVDVLGSIARTAEDSGDRALAEKLQAQLGGTKIFAAGPNEMVTETSMTGDLYSGERVATYDPLTDTINIHNGGASVASILHESTHAATLAQLKAGEILHSGNQRPRNQHEARLKAGYGDLLQVMGDVRKLPGAKEQYGLLNPKEFVAEMHTNPKFRAFLKQRGFWGRLMNGVRRLLGMSEKEGPFLERAIEASEPFFAQDRISDYFQSPDTMPLALDGMLSRIILTSDADRTPFSKMNDAAFNAVLPAKTLHYIAHQIRGIPELVATGFSRAVDSYQQATISQRVASNYLRGTGSAYIDSATRVLRAVGDPDKAREVQREMAVIGMEASRLGFDYRKNGKDNIAADANLTQADKAHIDDIHRRFTQLQKQYPDAAKVLESGERLNRTFLLDTVATIATNYMDARAGVARRLATELERMDPADAKRADLVARVQAMTLESTFADKHAKGLDFMDPSLRTAANSKPEFFHDGAAAAIYGRLAEMFKDARALPDGTPLRAHMAALESMYGAQVKNPYFSLGREGDYFVKVGFKGVDTAANARIQGALKGLDMVVGDLTRGDDHAFFRVESASAAQALHDRLVLAGEGKVVDTAWGLQTEKLNSVSGVAPALRTLLSGLDDMVAHTPGMSGEHAAAMRETLTRQILSMLPETASRSASMSRRGIPGYSSNFVTSFARRGEAAVHDIAGAYTARSYSQAAQMRADALEQINRTGSAQARLRAGAVNNEIVKRFADTMKPVENTHVAQATSMSHSFYLGLSPGYFIRTMAQPYLRGLPYIGSKFGFTTALAEMGGATPVAMQVISNSMKAALAADGARGLLGAPIELQGLNLPPHEMAFINELYLRGELDLGQSGQLLHAAMRPGSQKMQDVLRFVALTARGAEMSNRLIMGLASFRLAHKRPSLLGKDTPTPTEYAIRAIDRGMDNFDPSNTDRLTSRHGFAGGVTPLLTQFQKFAFQTMEQIARTVHDGYFGQDKSPEGLLRAKEAKREFAGLMATTGMMAGALGLPFASAFAGIYNNLMSDEDDPEDVRISIRNWATTAFGKDVGDVLMKGPGTALGVDTSTFGLQGLFPGTEFLANRMAFKERAEEQMVSMLGPAVSLGVDLATGASKIADGYWLKGIEAMLPVGLRTFFKAEELARVGYTDSKGNPITVGTRPPGEVGAADIAWRALGFQTAAKADQGDAARDHYMNQQLLARRRGQIKDEYIKAMRDPSILADAGQHLRAFNAKNPTQPITGSEITGSIRQYLTGQALAQASGTGVAVSKRQFPALVENERFAAMPGR